MARLCSSLLLSLIVTSSASAVTMDWTFVDNPGNACDQQADGCFGAVAYTYSIGTYEVTNAQYAEFLNAKAKSDPLALYDPNMGSGTGGYRGITRSGTSGSYVYAPQAGGENTPVTYVYFYDALRFVNWLNNGQGDGDTETGTYALMGGTPNPTNGDAVTRNPAASIVLPSEDEWFKAAYYDATANSYFDYAASAASAPNCANPTSSPNSANCFHLNPAAFVAATPIGSYPGSPSAHDAFDMGGNASEWVEAIANRGGRVNRVLRGGSFRSNANNLAASYRDYHPMIDFGSRDWQGFRVAMIPEPSTGLLVIAGMLGLAGWRRARDERPHTNARIPSRIAASVYSRRV